MAVRSIAPSPVAAAFAEVVILEAAPTIAAAASSAEPWKGCFASGSSSGGAMALAFFEGACICEMATVQMVPDRALGPKCRLAIHVSI